jgi:hypothetical protein
MSRYTFCMKLAAWILVIAAIAGLVYWFRGWRSRQAERQRASEQRFAALLSSHAKPAVTKERLLLDAAAKAAEAGEPALSIQLYARLLARFPDSALAEQARAALEEQKRNLAKA